VATRVEASESPVPTATPAGVEADAPERTHHFIRDRRRTILFPELLPHIPVIAVMLAYAVYFSRLTIEIYRGYGSPGFDMGIYDQGVWLLSRFHAPFVTIMGRNLFGDHASLILLLVTPFYWIYPRAPTLLVLQSVSLALGALPVYLLARVRLGSTALATVLGGAFLLHPAIQGGNLEQFHPECFLVPLIGFAVYFAVTWRPRWLLLTVVLCLLVKEDAALLIVPLGLWVCLRKDRRLGLKLMVGAVVAALISTQVVMRRLFGVPELHADRIPFGGWHGFRVTVLRKPGKLVDYLKSDRRPFYVWQMLIPNAMLFVRAPEIAAIATLVVGVNVLSTFGYQHQLFYHYSLAVVPVVAMGTVFAIGAIHRLRWRALAVGSVAVLSLWATFLWGSLPAISINKVGHWRPSDPQVHDINAVLSALPPNAVVSAHYDYITHVDHRVRVYQWPTPFKASYWGLLKQEGQRLPFADQVQYVFVPLTMDKANMALLDTIRPHFEVVRQVGNSILLRRVSPGP
jgi:uncharacterized membrane protein